MPETPLERALEWFESRKNKDGCLHRDMGLVLAREVRRLRDELVEEKQAHSLSAGIAIEHTNALRSERDRMLEAVQMFVDCMDGKINGAQALELHNKAMANARNILSPAQPVAEGEGKSCCIVHHFDEDHSPDCAKKGGGDGGR